MRKHEQRPGHRGPKNSSLCRSHPSAPRRRARSPHGCHENHHAPSRRSSSAAILGEDQAGIEGMRPAVAEIAGRPRSGTRASRSGGAAASLAQRPPGRRKGQEGSSGPVGRQGAERPRLSRRSNQAGASRPRLVPRGARGRHPSGRRAGHRATSADSRPFERTKRGAPGQRANSPHPRGGWNPGIGSAPTSGSALRAQAA
jgi:hypothetical protein